MPSLRFCNALAGQQRGGIREQDGREVSTKHGSGMVDPPISFKVENLEVKILRQTSRGGFGGLATTDGGRGSLGMSDLFLFL